MNKSRFITYVISCILYIFLFAITTTISLAQTQPFIKGADVSFLPQIEKYGGVYKDSGSIKDAFQIFKDHGFNYVRLRIWNKPGLPDTANDLAHTLQLALRAKQHGLRILLDFHYSDTWADPGHQTKPNAWSSLSFDHLKDSVYRYSNNVITALKNQHTLPDMVQIGNEIICGILWNDGNVCDAFNTSAQWSKLAQLLNSGAQGVRDALSFTDSIRIMIHLDRGGDNGGCRWFFDNLMNVGVQFDVIGLSYYPWWHGELSQLSSNLNDLATRYNKDIIIAETAYPWTLQWNDDGLNLVGDSSQLLAGYPATVSGQRAFLEDEISIIKQLPNNKGKGIFYWEPDWITAPLLSSAGENLALFDFQGNALSSFGAFESPGVSYEVQQGWNIVSLPIISFDQTKNSLYPSSSSVAFSFETTGYIQQETLQSGKGYWLKYSSHQNCIMKGDSLFTMKIKVNAGWNLIGTISSPIDIHKIVQVPSNNIQSEFFGYSNGYHSADTLIPGQGYWIKVNGPGELILHQ